MPTYEKAPHVTAVAGLDPDRPVVMLNLIKFRERSLDGKGAGRDAYDRYGAHAMPLIRKRGGAPLWAGDVRAVALGPVAEGDWDFAVLVRYPTPAAFLEMVSSPEYLAGAEDLENGVERHVILALHEGFSKL